MPEHTEKWHRDLLSAVSATNVSPATLAQFEQLLQSQEATLPFSVRAANVWRFLSRFILHPGHEFGVHQRVLQACYAQWPAQTLGPPPVWLPGLDDVKSHNITAFLARFQGDAIFEAVRTGPARELPLDPTHDYPHLHALSVRAPEVIYSALLRGTLRIPFHLEPQRILDFDPSTGNPDTASWLPGASMNIAFCALCSARAQQPHKEAPALTNPAPGSSGPSRKSHASSSHRAAAGFARAGSAPQWSATTHASSAISNAGHSSNSSDAHTSRSASPSATSSCSPSGTQAEPHHTQHHPHTSSSTHGSHSRNVSDRWVWGDSACEDSKPAIVWAEERAPQGVHSISMGELRAEASRVACAVRCLVQPGDAVAMVLPMTPLAVAAYLGIILAGCVVVSVADSFAAEEVAVRLRIAQARLIVTQDMIMRSGKQLPLYPRVAVAANAPQAVVLPCRAWGTTHAPLSEPLRTGDMSWDAFLSLPSAQPSTPHPTSLPHPSAPPSPQPASSSHSHGSAAQPMHTASSQPSRPSSQPPQRPPPWLHCASPSRPCNVLFSSGTTGEPKAIAWTHATPLRCAVDGWAHQGLQPGDVCCWPTSLGWMMGPWLVFAALLNGCTIALYSGSPLGHDFGQFVAAAGVSMLGLVPSIAKAWRHSGCMQGLDWPLLKVISSTGEASSPDDSHWLMALMRYRVPIIEYCGGTELAGGYATGTTLQPCCPSTFTTPAIGTHMVLLTSSPPPQPAHTPQKQSNNTGFEPLASNISNAHSSSSSSHAHSSASNQHQPPESALQALLMGSQDQRNSSADVSSIPHAAEQLQHHQGCRDSPEQDSSPAVHAVGVCLSTCGANAATPGGNVTTPTAADASARVSHRAYGGSAVHAMGEGLSACAGSAAAPATADANTRVSHHAFGGSAVPAVGEVALVTPTLGASQYLLNKDHFKAYYAGMPCVPFHPPPHTGSTPCLQGQAHVHTQHVHAVPLRRHGDELQRLPGGYYTALGRVDDTMNLGGIKVASVELERCVLENVEGVAEAAAVGVPSAGGGPEQLHLFLVLPRKDTQTSMPTPSAQGQQPHQDHHYQHHLQQTQQQQQKLHEACQAAIRTHLSPLFRVSRVRVRDALPRNASNKVMRRVLRDEVLASERAKLQSKL